MSHEAQIGSRLASQIYITFNAGDASEAAPAVETVQGGSLRADQMAKLDVASSDDEMLEGGGIVLEDTAAKHVDGVSQTGATAGNHAAAAALQARLHGEHAAHAHTKAHLLPA